MNKELSKLISLKNSYIKQNDLEKLELIRSEIKKLKKEKNEILSSSISTKKYNKCTRFSIDDSNKKNYKIKKKNEKKDEYVSSRKKKNDKIKKKLSIKYVSYNSVNIISQKKKKIKKVICDDLQIISFTKKQEELLNNFYSGKITDCNIGDFIKVFSYYIKNTNIGLESLKAFIEFFNNTFISTDNSKLVHKFYKCINEYIKGYNKKEKDYIKTMYCNVDDISCNKKKNSPIFEIIKYFIDNNNSAVLSQIIDKYPDIMNCSYNNKSIVINALEYMLDKYNLIMYDCKCDNPVIKTSEDVFIKLYNKETSIKLQVKAIVDAYIDELKKKNANTISKNMIAYRLSIVSGSLGLVPQINLFDGAYDCLIDYYKFEMNNSSRKKLNEVSVNLDGLSSVSYSISKLYDESYILRINIVDTSIYFIDDTALNDILLNNSIDKSKFSNYIKYKNNSVIPSITFEFYYYNGVLKNKSVYNSIVRTTTDEITKRNYYNMLPKINIKQNSLLESFDILLKELLLDVSKNKIPYIIRYKNENDNYRTITDLNYLFSKLNRDELDVIYSILDDLSIKYGMSDDIKYISSYDLDILSDDLNVMSVLLRKIIRSYYDNTVKINLDYINESVKKKNKVLTKH